MVARGSGLRHVDTQCLWIQQRVRDRTIELVKVRGEESPADLFTKHLTGQDRIHGLLKLLGCSYADGRAASAPQFRAGAGTSKGELLALKSAAAVNWHGQILSAIEHEGELLPEAYESQLGFLPHMHHDRDARYPRAVVEHEPGDREPEQDTVVEQRGIGLGRQAARPLARAPVRTPDQTPVNPFCCLD